VSIFGAVKERTFQLIETGEYVLTLNDLTEESGAYGDAIKFVWLVAPVSDPTNYLCNANGMEKTLHAYTDADITIGSQNHEWVQVLTGRQFGKDDAPPEMDELLGRRMIAYITHQAPKKGPNAGKLREKIVAGSAKPFKGPQPNKVIYAPAAPAQPSEDAEDRAVLVKRAEKLIGKAVMLETPLHLDYVALDLNTIDSDELTKIVANIDREVKSAIAS
jgi:hypothetical protein